VLSGQAILTLGTGTAALTATGTALQSISATQICSKIPPAPAGAYIIGCAYDYTPNNATFNPPVTLTLRYDPNILPAGVDARTLALAYYDSTAGKWVPRPSTVATLNHIVTAQVSHFTLFAVYAPAPVATPTPTATVTPAPPTSTPTPSPVSGKKTNPGAIIGVVVAVIVIGLVLYLLLRRRKPPAPTPPTGAQKP